MASPWFGIPIIFYGVGILCLAAWSVIERPDSWNIKDHPRKAIGVIVFWPIPAIYLGLKYAGKGVVIILRAIFLNRLGPEEPEEADPSEFGRTDSVGVSGAVPAGTALENLYVFEWYSIIARRHIIRRRVEDLKKRIPKLAHLESLPF